MDRGETKTQNWNENNIYGRRFQGRLEKLFQVNILQRDELDNVSVDGFKQLIKNKLETLFIEKRAIDILLEKISNAERKKMEENRGEEKNSGEKDELERNIGIWSTEEVILRQAFLEKYKIGSIGESQAIAKHLFKIIAIFDETELFVSAINDVRFNEIPISSYISNPLIAVDVWKNSVLPGRTRGQRTNAPANTGSQQTTLSGQVEPNFTQFELEFNDASRGRSSIAETQQTFMNAQADNTAAIGNLEINVNKMMAMQEKILDQGQKNGMGISKNEDLLKKQDDKLSEAKEALKSLSKDFKTGMAKLTSVLQKCTTEEMQKSYANMLSCLLSIFLAVLGIFILVSQLFFRFAQLGVGLSKSLGRVTVGLLPIVGGGCVELVGVCTAIAFFLIYARLVSAGTGGLVDGQYVAGEFLAAIQSILMFLFSYVRYLWDSLSEDMTYFSERLGVEELKETVMNETRVAVDDALSEIQNELDRRLGAAANQALGIENAQGEQTWLGDALLLPINGINAATNGVNNLWDYFTSQEQVDGVVNAMGPEMGPEMGPVLDTANVMEQMAANTMDATDAMNAAMDATNTINAAMDATQAVPSTALETVYPEQNPWDNFGGGANVNSFDNQLKLVFSIINKCTIFNEKLAGATTIGKNGVAMVEVKRKLVGGKWINKKEKIKMEDLLKELDTIKNSPEKTMWSKKSKAQNKGSIIEIYKQKEVDFYNLIKNLMNILSIYKFDSKKNTFSRKDNFRDNHESKDKEMFVTPLKSIFEHLGGEGFIPNSDFTPNSDFIPNSFKLPKFVKKEILIGGKKSKRRLKKKKKKTKRKSRKKRKNSKKRKKKKRKTKKY